MDVTYRLQFAHDWQRSLRVWGLTSTSCRLCFHLFIFFVFFLHPKTKVGSFLLFSCPAIHDLICLTLIQDDNKCFTCGHEGQNVKGMLQWKLWPASDCFYLQFLAVIVGTQWLFMFCCWIICVKCIFLTFWCCRQACLVCVFRLKMFTVPLPQGHLLIRNHVSLMSHTESWLGNF